VLQCVTVRCSALQCVAVCCKVLQCVAMRCSVLQCPLQQQKPGRTLTLRCVAVCCGVSQYVAVSSVATAAWSYSRTTPFVFVRDITHPYVSHDSFTCVLQDVLLSHYSSEAAILKSQLANKHTSNVWLYGGLLSQLTTPSFFAPSHCLLATDF